MTTITIEQIEKEGLSEKFLELIEDDLNQESFIDCKEEDIYTIKFINSLLKNAQERVLIRLNVEEFEKRFKENMKLSKKQELFFSVALLPPMRIFMPEECYDAMSDWREFNREMIPHYRQLSQINSKIRKNNNEINITFPNVTKAYSHLMRGIAVSANTCQKVFEEKRRICKLLANTPAQCEIYIPTTQYSLKENEKVLQESLEMIQEREKTLLKSW